jgi:hypothetical protein
MSCRVFTDDGVLTEALTQEFLEEEVGACTALGIEADRDATLPLAVSISLPSAEASTKLDAAIKHALVSMLTSGVLSECRSDGDLYATTGASPSQLPFATAFIWKAAKGNTAIVALPTCFVSEKKAAIAALAAQRMTAANIKVWNRGDFVLPLPGSVSMRPCSKCRKACTTCGLKGYVQDSPKFRDKIWFAHVSFPAMSTLANIVHDSTCEFGEAKLADAALHRMAATGPECENTQPVFGLPTQAFQALDLTPLQHWKARNRTAFSGRTWLDVDGPKLKIIERAVSDACDATRHCFLAGARQKNEVYGGLIVTRGFQCVNGTDDCTGGIVAFSLANGKDGPKACLTCVCCRGFDTKAAAEVKLNLSTLFLELWDDPRFMSASTTLRHGFTEKDRDEFIMHLENLKRAVIALDKYEAAPVASQGVGQSAGAGAGKSAGAKRRRQPAEALEGLDDIEMPTGGDLPGIGDVLHFESREACGGEVEIESQ